MLSVLRRNPFAFAGAVALVGACSNGNKTADSARVTDSTAVAATATSAVTPAAPAVTDPHIFAFLEAANVADSAAGSIAAAKGTAASVKTFGRDMMRDHHALRVAGQDLAKKLRIMPEAAPGDNIAAAATAWRDSLTAMPRGAAWDKAYIDHEVIDHQNVLNTMQTDADGTQNAEVRALIEKAAPIIQQHLDHAKQIQSTLK
jgi:putative membrane protein